MSLNTKPLSLILAMFVASYGFAVERGQTRTLLQHERYNIFM